MALSRWGAGISSSSLQLSTCPSGQGGPRDFAALMPASLHSHGSAAATFAMWGCGELPCPVTCPSCCEISRLGIHSSQGCSDKSCSPAELGELSLGLLPWRLTGRAVPFSISWAGHKDRCLSLWEALATFCELLIQLRVHSFCEKNCADAMRRVRQSAVMHRELFCKV